MDTTLGFSMTSTSSGNDGILTIQRPLLNCESFTSPDHQQLNY